MATRRWEGKFSTMHSELSDEQYRLLQTFNDLAAGSPTTDVAAGNEDEFVEHWKQAASYLRQREGFVSTRLHQSLDPHAPFRFINVAVWESVEHFQQAMSTPEFQELAGEMPFSSHPALYRVISE